MTDRVRVEPTAIPGLLILHLPVHRDPRGWFKENWHRQAMVEAGLPDFGPVQHNVAFNSARGTTRGVHAEPWDKLVSLATGRALGAWVDLRPGPTFGTVLTRELDVQTAAFVPRGVGNAYQTLVDDTAYSYLVNAHWSASAGYAAVDPGDPALGIEWPMPLAQAVVSEKDRRAPSLADVTPLPGRRTLILGASGQVGRALAREFPDALAIDREELDLGDPAALEAWHWPEYDVVINAAADTRVDEAETADGRTRAWAVNALAPTLLGRLGQRHGFALVHYSTDYVFDGRTTRPDGYREGDPVSPLGVYGQSKSAGELGVSATRRHYVLRTSWVVGDGANFVRTMADLADRGARPRVVDDQTGRLTSAAELATATRSLLTGPAAPGIYHVTGGGPEVSWYDVARRVFELRGRDPDTIAPVSTAAYQQERVSAPRPARGMLDWSKAAAAGVAMSDAETWLGSYVSGLSTPGAKEG